MFWFHYAFLVLSLLFLYPEHCLKRGGVCEDLIIRGYLLVYFDMHVEQGDSGQEVEGEREEN